MRRVIISGANGFIGTSLVEKFYKSGYEVVALVRNRKEDITKIQEYAQIVYSELSNKNYLVNELKSDKETVFYHLAWIGVNGPQKAEYDAQIENIHLTCDCISIAKAIGCSRFLAAGTVAERAVESFSRLDKVSPGLLYSVSKCATKLFTEHMCKSLGIEYVWMQFSNIYGPGNKTGNLVSYTISTLNENKEAIYGPALQPYDFIYIDDLIEAVYRLGNTKVLNKNEYFIGSGSPRLLKDYLIEIGAVMNKSKYIRIGMRPDDGIKYEFGMFDISDLIKDIGNYVAMNFSEGILYTINNYY